MPDLLQPQDHAQWQTAYVCGVILSLCWPNCPSWTTYLPSVDTYIIRENLHIAAISSTTYLPCLVNIVKERPPCLVCYLLLYQIHSDQWVQVISWFWRQKTCMYVSMNVMYNSCKNTSRWLLQTNLSRSKSGVQLWALTRLASKKRNKKPKRMMRVLIL